MGVPASALSDCSGFHKPPAPADRRVFCRTDYHLATPALAALARSEHIYKDVKFSDHAPVTVDYGFTI